MAVGCFAHQFFNAVSIHVDRWMGPSREGSFAGQVKIGVLYGSQVYFYGGIGVDKQTAPAKVCAGSNLCINWQCKQTKRS
jgi:hypothetical protein